MEKDQKDMIGEIIEAFELSGCVVYVFEDENGFFIEQPYNGIFSIEEKQYAEILGLLF